MMSRRQLLGTAAPWGPTPDDPPEGLIHLFDDFADDSLCRRDRKAPLVEPPERPIRIVRPVWTVIAGDPAAVDGRLVFPGDGNKHAVNKFSDVIDGHWEVIVEMNARGGAFDLYPLAPASFSHPLVERLCQIGALPQVDPEQVTAALDILPRVGVGPGFWRVRFDATGRLVLQRKRDGSVETVLSDDRSENGPVRIGVRREDGEWRLIRNGSLVGSWHDAFVPSGRTMRLATSGSMGEVTVRRVRVDQPM